MANDSKQIVTEEKKATARNKSRRGIAAVSLLISLFDKFGEWLYNCIVNGLFGRMFTCYQRLHDKFTDGILGRALFGNHRIRRFCRKGRKFLSNVIDSSVFVSAWKRCSDYFCSLPLSYYGNFAFFFGAYTVVVYLAKLFIPGLGEASIDYLIVGGALTLGAVPTLFAKRSLAMSVKRSVICSSVFQGALGFSDDTLNRSITVKGKGNFMLFLGLVAGTLTFFINPIYMIAAFLVFLLGIFVANFPEIGVLVTIFSVPFLSFSSNPTVILCALVLYTSFFYIIKLIRGKRVFKIELIDAFVLIFMAFMMLSCFFNAGGQPSVNSVLVSVSLMFGYFLVTNLMRTEKWIMRCVYALISSAVIVAFIGIAENFFAESNNAWLDLSMFSNIRIRVVSLFENPNVLSVFLTIVFPFALAAFCLAKAKNEKLLASLACITILACIVFTWSRGAWLAVIIGTFVFLLIYSNKKTFRAIGAFFVFLPFVPILVPDSVVDRFLSMFNLSDSSISYRIYTWRGTFRAIEDYWLGGIGFGNESFKQIYPGYAYSGIEAAEHSHSLFLQILLYLGVFGLVLFGIIIFLSIQKSFEYIKKPENKRSKIYVIATVAAILSAMIMGVFDYIWYNYRVFYIFWIVIALGCAFIRVGNYETKRKQTASTDGD